MAVRAARRWLATWGNGDFGRLGHGAMTGEELPRRVLHGAIEGLDIRQVSCGGAHTAVVTGDGGLYAFGLNDHGQLGLGMDTKWAEVATQVDIPEAVVAVGAGHHHTVCLTEGGRVWAFGRNHRGQLGIGGGGGGAVAEPMLVGGFGGAALGQVVAGANHTMLVTREGELYTWGCGENGRLGHGDEERYGAGGGDESAPRLVRALRGVRVASAAAGHLHSGCVDDQGRVYMWGYGRHWALAVGHDRDVLAPEELDGVHSIAQLAAGGSHTAAITSAGQLFTWGFNHSGELGTGGGPGAGDGRAPSAVDAPPVRSVACGWKHTAAATADGRLLAWGWGGNEGTSGEGDGIAGGQLGVGNPFDYYAPEPVAGILSAESMSGRGRRVESVACGFNHTAAVVSSLE